MAEPTPSSRIPPGIRALLAAVFVAHFGLAAVFPIVGLQVFQMTGRELDLGLLGLAQFLPVLLLAPFSGTLADRFDRRKVWATGLGLELIVVLGLGFYIGTDPTAVGPIFLLMSAFGVAASIVAPASRALPIDLSPIDIVSRVVALRTSAFQLASITAPVVAAWLFTRSPDLPYFVAAGAYLVTFVLLTIVPRPSVPTKARAITGRQAIKDAFDGLRFIRRTPILLGAISLDLFAVLLGGAIALLPAIAEKLGVGPIGFGWLRAAVGIGALLSALTLAARPMRRRVGRNLLMAVSIFGVAIIVLGATPSYPVAVGALLVAASADAVSMFVRSTLVPLATPEQMRGRVLAVENVFIGGSNELGAVESGVAGELLGVTWAVITGGLGTLVVVGAWWKLFPDLRNVDRFDEVSAAVAPASPMSAGP